MDNFPLELENAAETHLHDSWSEDCLYECLHEWEVKSGTAKAVLTRNKWNFSKQHGG